VLVHPPSRDASIKTSSGRDDRLPSFLVALLVNGTAYNTLTRRGSPQPGHPQTIHSPLRLDSATETTKSHHHLHTLGFLLGLPDLLSVAECSFRPFNRDLADLSSSCRLFVTLRPSLPLLRLLLLFPPCFFLFSDLLESLGKVVRFGVDPRGRRVTECRDAVPDFLKS
jgi:hypothetical protein